MIPPIFERIAMGRLNKKLTLKAKKAGKTPLTLAKVAAVEGTDNNVQTSKPGPAPVSVVASVASKQPIQEVSVSIPVPKKLSKVTKKEKRKLKSEGLKTKLSQLAREKQEAKGEYLVSTTYPKYFNESTFIRTMNFINVH